MRPSFGPRDKRGTRVHEEESFGSEGLGAPSSGSRADELCSSAMRIASFAGSRVPRPPDVAVSPFDSAQLRDSLLRALRIGSPNQIEPFPSTVSSAWFRSPQLAFYHLRSGPDISG